MSKKAKTKKKPVPKTRRKAVPLVASEPFMPAKLIGLLPGGRAGFVEYVAKEVVRQVQIELKRALPAAVLENTAELESDGSKPWPSDGRFSEWPSSEGKISILSMSETHLLNAHAMLGRLLGSLEDLSRDDELEVLRLLKWRDAFGDELAHRLRMRGPSITTTEHNVVNYAKAAARAWKLGGANLFDVSAKRLVKSVEALETAEKKGRP